MPLNRSIATLGCLFVSGGVWLTLNASTVAAPAERTESKPLGLLQQLDDAFSGLFEKVAPAVVIVEAAKPVGQEERDESFEYRFRPPQGDGGRGNGNSEEEKSDRRLFRMPQTRSEGSGFIVRAEGYIFTNHHVVEDAEKVQVKLKDGRRFPANLIGSDDKTDIAVLKIDAANLPVAPLGDSDAVRVGQLCFAIGIPFNLDYSFSGGFVSAKGRSNLTSSPTKPMYEDYIQTDAFINPGNSGGPLFDVDGRVIGMNTLINGIGRGLAFAIPSNMLKDVGEQLIATGKITRPWLGIRIETLGDNASLREHIQGIDKGVIVDTIEPDAPAYRSDLRPADVITQVDGVPVASARDLQREVLKKKVGQSVDLAVWRNGKMLKVAVTTGELPGDFTKVTNAPKKQSAEPKGDSVFGIRVQDVPAAVKEPSEKNRGSGGGSKALTPAGAVVMEVEPGSPADEAGVEAGDLITEVDQKPVAHAAACRNMLRSHPVMKSLLLVIDRKGEKTFVVIKKSDSGGGKTGKLE